MRVLALPILRDFWSEHPDSETSLRAWYKLVERATWQNLAEVRRDYPHADQVGRKVVFNICGNKYRLIAKFAYPKGKAYILGVLTHKDYDRGDWKED